MNKIKKPSASTLGYIIKFLVIIKLAITLIQLLLKEFRRSDFYLMVKVK